MSGHFNLLLRSRRIQACAAITVLAAVAIGAVAYAPFLSAAAKAIVSGIVVLVSALMMTIIVGRMIGLALEALPPPSTPSSSRLAYLATQIQASDINVARLAAKLERVETAARPEAVAVLDQIAQRLNALEHALAGLEGDGDATGHTKSQGVLGRLKSGIANAGDRLAKLENAELSVVRLEARLQLIEDQLASHAQNVERLTRHSA